METNTLKLKRKYQVFISSTFLDLAEARQQAQFGVIKAGHFALALENSGPETDSIHEVIKQSIAESQYYVIILGHRCGCVPRGQKNGLKKSYVELELDYAESINANDKKRLQVLAFVMPREKVERMRNALRHPKDTEEIKNAARYWKLYDRLTSRPKARFFRLFNTPHDLFVELFGYFSRDHDDVRGYVAEPKEKEDVDIFQISTKNTILRDVIKSLGNFTWVDPRLNLEIEKKLALATAFRQVHGTNIRDKWRKVFIESGSTLAYVAKELVNYLPRMHADHSRRRLITNNSTAYLYLWLCSKILCHPVPGGPPDNKYGAMLGDLTDLDRAPDYCQPPLEKYHPGISEVIEPMSKSIFGDPEENSHSILLAAASGLQLSDDLEIQPGAPIPDGLMNCRGFHGGSYSNRLFKRCMYMSKIPAFFFMHDTKIDVRIIPGLCHFLCDTGYPWEEFVRDYPFSIWIGCDFSTYDDVRRNAERWLTSGEWEAKRYGEPTTPILMLSNRAFRESCRNIDVVI